DNATLRWAFAGQIGPTEPLETVGLVQSLINGIRNLEVISKRPDGSYLHFRRQPDLSWANVGQMLPPIAWCCNVKGMRHVNQQISSVDRNEPVSAVTREEAI